MTDIDQKEIRGMTVKLLRGLIVQTIFIVAGAMSIYFTLKGDIRNIVTVREQGEKYWQLKFDQLQLQNSAFQKQLDNIQNQSIVTQKQLEVVTLRLYNLRNLNQQNPQQ